MDQKIYFDLSIDELDELIPALVARRKELVEKRRAELLAELEKLGGIPERPIPKPRVKRKPQVRKAPAYKDERGNYWSGRGMAPKWLKAHEACWTS